MKRLLCPLLIYCQLFTITIVFAYSRVSKNGEARSATGSEGVAFTVPSIYIVTPRTIDLKPGEAIDHPSTPKYSTLDEEMVAQLDSLSARSRAQERFHPPASFEHVLSHSNSLRQQQPTKTDSSSLLAGSSSNNDVIYAKPIVSMTYDYPAMNFDIKPKPKPTPSSNSFTIFSPEKFPDSFSSTLDNDSPPSQPSEYSGKSPSFDFNNPPKPVEISGHYDHPFGDVPAFAQGPYQHEVIYDHIPEDHLHHYHHHLPSSTEEPEVMDQRVNKRPYSYYYIGKKLWYIPLYFSIYFIIYIAALVLKSIARHKITFPPNPQAVARSVGSYDKSSPSWMDYATRVLEAIEMYKQRINSR